MSAKVPIITIDGPSGSGKGTIGRLLAADLGFNYLDSGALYRLLALAAQRHKVSLDNVEGLAILAAHMDVVFQMDEQGEDAKILFESEDVSQLIRSEDIGVKASIVAAIPEVRRALLQRQHAFAQDPGLVADGRDMGTVVFDKAEVKIFLTASSEERVKRRHKQLIGKGESDSLAALKDKVRERDDRDLQRSVSPLQAAEGAVSIDSTEFSVNEVFARVRRQVEKELNI
jgi:cytidylate kinase